MIDVAIAVAAALPWIVLPIIVGRRMRQTTSLDPESSEAPRDAPLVSVIVPARNEERNIATCIRSILGNTYPAFEVIVVNDHSTDDTAAIMRDIAREDDRVDVIDAADVPDGWLGKTWACETGASHARGEILCFTDADTAHKPEALVRSVNAMTRRNADLFSIYTGQRLETFWERVIQPQVFTLVSVRFGGTETVNRSGRAADKIANGQCLFARRAAYRELGGHAAVRAHAVEDIALAQRFFTAGREVVLMDGAKHVTTRMYTTLGELVRGWGRTLYAGHRASLPLGKAGSVAHPFLFLLLPAFQLLPAAVLASLLFVSLSAGLVVWALVAEGAMLVWWLLVYRAIRLPAWLAFFHVVGAAIVLYICLGAAFRGRRISWKERAYRIE